MRTVGRWSLALAGLSAVVGCAAMQKMHEGALKSKQEEAKMFQATASKQARFVFEGAKLSAVKKVAVVAIYAPDFGAISSSGEYATYDNQPVLDHTETALAAALGKAGYQVIPLADTKAAFAAGYQDAQIDEAARIYGITKEEEAQRVKDAQKVLDAFQGADDPETQAMLKMQQEKNQKIQEDGQLLHKKDIASANTFLISDLGIYWPRKYKDVVVKEPPKSAFDKTGVFDSYGVWSTALQRIVGSFATKLGADAAIVIAEETRPVTKDEKHLLGEADHHIKAAAQVAMGVISSDGSLIFADRLDTQPGRCGRGSGRDPGQPHPHPGHGELQRCPPGGGAQQCGRPGLGHPLRRDEERRRGPQHLRGERRRCGSGPDPQVQLLTRSSQLSACPNGERRWEPPSCAQSCPAWCWRRPARRPARWPTSRA